MRHRRLHRHHLWAVTVSKSLRFDSFWIDKPDPRLAEDGSYLRFSENRFEVWRVLVEMVYEAL